MNLDTLKTIIRGWRPEAKLFGFKQKEWAAALNQYDNEKAHYTAEANGADAALNMLCARFFPDHNDINDWASREEFANAVLAEVDKASGIVEDLAVKLSEEDKKYGELEAKHQDLLKKLKALSPKAEDWDTPDAEADEKPDNE